MSLPSQEEAMKRWQSDYKRYVVRMFLHSKGFELHPYKAVHVNCYELEDLLLEFDKVLLDHFEQVVNSAAEMAQHLVNPPTIIDKRGAIK